MGGRGAPCKVVFLVQILNNPAPRRVCLLVGEWMKCVYVCGVWNSCLAKHSINQMPAVVPVTSVFMAVCPRDHKLLIYTRHDLEVPTWSLYPCSLYCLKWPWVEEPGVSSSLSLQAVGTLSRASSNSCGAPAWQHAENGGVLYGLFRLHHFNFWPLQSFQKHLGVR